jgi:hypothetical protein
MCGAYRLTQSECIKYLTRLNQIGIIELKPLNRYRLKLAKTFRWRLHDRGRVRLQHDTKHHAVGAIFECRQMPATTLVREQSRMLCSSSP